MHDREPRERRSIFSGIAAPRLTDRTRRRAQHERAIVRLAIIVAAKTKESGYPSDEDRGRDARDAEIRRVERRNVGSPAEIRPGQDRPRRICDEDDETESAEQGTDPPAVDSFGRAEPGNPDPRDMR